MYTLTLIHLKLISFLSYSRNEISRARLGFLIMASAEEFDIFITCTLCKSFFKDPIVLGGCQHVFCDACFRDHGMKSSNQHCPTCGNDISHLESPSRLLKSLISQKSETIPESQEQVGPDPQPEPQLAHLVSEISERISFLDKYARSKYCSMRSHPEVLRGEVSDEERH